jgi:hypothetical protein
MKTNRLGFWYKLTHETNLKILTTVHLDKNK